jgi:hypothetical protein
LNAAASEVWLASNFAPAVACTMRCSSAGLASPNWMAKVFTDLASSGRPASPATNSSAEMPRLFSPSVISTIEVNDPRSRCASATARW